MENQGKKSKLGGCLLIIVFMLSIGFIFKTCMDSSEKEIKNNKADGSVWQIKAYLQTNLKDPESYQAIEWGQVRQIKKEPVQYLVRHKYRAKNSFGGYVISTQYFTIDDNGKVIKVE
jgi:hypothetical protein